MRVGMLLLLLEVGLASFTEKRKIIRSLLRALAPLDLIRLGLVTPNALAVGNYLCNLCAILTFLQKMWFGMVSGIGYPAYLHGSCEMLSLGIWGK